MTEDAAPSYPRFAWSGYTQIQFHDPEDGDSSVFPRRVFLSIRGDVTDQIGFRVLFDPSREANLLRDAYISAKLGRYHTIHVGQIKTAFGYENPETPSKMLTIQRAYVSSALGRGPSLRDLGAGLYGDYPLATDLDGELDVTLVNGSGQNVFTDDTPRKNLWSRAGLHWTIAPIGLDVHLGASFAVGDRLDPVDPATPDDKMEVDFLRFGGDLRLDHPWAFLAAEAIFGRDESFGVHSDRNGFYITLVGKTPWHVGPLARVERLDNGPTDDRRRYTLGAYWDLHGRNARLAFNYELDDSEPARADELRLQAQIYYK